MQDPSEHYTSGNTRPESESNAVDWSESMSPQSTTFVGLFAHNRLPQEDIALTSNQPIQVYRGSQPGTRIIPCAQRVSDSIPKATRSTMDTIKPREETSDSADDLLGTSIAKLEVEVAQMALLKQSMWDIGTSLTVSFMNCQDIPPPVIAAVKKHAKRWTIYANVSFEFIDNDEPGTIRVAFMEDKGHYSYLGRSCQQIDKDKPTMNLDPLEINELMLQRNENRFRQVVLHEFGHALGCVHEHSQPNAEIKWNKAVIYDYYQSRFNWSKEMVDDNILCHYTSESRLLHATRLHDKYSIMQYSFGRAFTHDGFFMPGGDDLSTKDQKFINKLYPYPSTADTGIVIWDRFGTSTSSDKLRLSCPLPSHYQFASKSTETPPSILLGITRLDVKQPPHLLISCDVDPGDSMMNLDTLVSSKLELETFGCTWLALSESDADFEFDHISITPKSPGIPKRWKKSLYLPRNVTIPITFKTPYSIGDIPTVSIWIHAIDSTSDFGLDIKVSANRIDGKGFMLECYIAQETECKVREVGVTWFAHSPTKRDICSGSFGVQDSSQLESDDDTDSPDTSTIFKGSQEFTFVIPVKSPPKIFMGFSELHIDSKSDICISVTHDAATPAEEGWKIDWRIDTWGKTTMNAAQVTCIAIKHAVRVVS
ncbi:hypothetical protein QCA50_011607 [Cerrena zonata]|uniref:Peptidase metallopeptidase domain-containing protein n=1 Tax=Cerrena zonata TaxID=2478898 RepID=A0AAW0G0L5_9APHY